MRAKLAVKYIFKSGLSCSLHEANDSNRKLLLVSMSRPHSMSLFNKTYGWLGTLTGMLLF